MDDTDLRGLSAEEARAYALEFLTALKGLDREFASLDEEIALWGKRVELAASKNAVDLEAAARAKLDELGAKKAAIEAERDELKVKVGRIKEKMVLAGATERSVDPDLLLAQLQMATGEALDGPPSKLESDLAALGADDALAALKRKMEEGKA